MFKMQQILCMVIILMLTLPAMAQTDGFSKHSLKYGIGTNFVNGTQIANDAGFFLLVGYQRDVWKDRLRFNPNLSLGSMSTVFTTHSRNEWHSVMNLQIGFQYDLFRLGSFSLVLAGGGVLNRSKGLVGSFRNLSGDRIGGGYVYEWNYGGYAGAGIRYSPKISRVAFEVMPLNAQLGPGKHKNGYYQEVYFSIGMEIKLR